MKYNMLMVLTFFFNPLVMAETGNADQYAGATTLTVGTDSNCDFNQIQDAIDSVSGTDFTRIHITTQQAWFENLVIDNEHKVGLFGQFLNCSNDDLDTQPSVINASSTPSQTGISITDSSEIYFRRLKIKEASLFGGIVVNNAGTIYFTNVDIRKNTRLFGDAGGGMQIVNNSVVTMSGTTFFKNSAGNGGALSCNNSQVSITNPNIIENNTFDVADNSNHGKGGGIYATNGCDLFIKTFFSTTYPFGQGVIDNTASFKGGGLYADGGSTVQINEANPFFYLPVTFSGNQVNLSTNSFGGGGAIALAGITSVVAQRLILDDNAVIASPFQGFGGALHVSNAAKFHMQLDSTGNGCDQFPDISDEKWCNRISNNKAHFGGMIHLASSGKANINHTYINKNHSNSLSPVNVTHMGDVLSGLLTMQGNIITDNAVVGGSVEAQLFLIGTNGKIQIDFTTFDNNHLPNGRLINGFESEQIDVTRSIINEADDTSVFFDSSGLNLNITDFDCLLSHEDSSFSGTDITIGAPLYQTTWPWHLADNSPGINMCTSSGTLTTENDMDGDQRGPCANPIICAIVPRRFDAGADEYRISDLIFKNGYN